MKKLFTEFSIKNVKMKNRICVPPMVIGFRDDGYVASENVERYTELAKGGAGLIIQEATCVNNDGKLSKNQLGIWEDGQIEGLKSIVNAVHKEDCPIFIQIHHAGVVGISEDPICPSSYEYKNYSGSVVVGHEMTSEDIKSIQNNFIEAATRAYRAGYDGVELHGCHAYLISQFLNKKVNKRTDKYGSNPEKFVIEIIEGIRNVTPKEFIVGIRLGGFEPTIEDGIHYAKVLEKNGINLLDISYGFMSEQEMNVNEKYKYSNAVYAAQKIKEEVSIPVFAVNGINSAEIAEEILNETNVDIVDIAKGFLINPNWANDAKEGKDTGKCLNCAKCMWFGQSKVCVGKVIFERDNK
ncbi:NADH:flavin oxidoreductase [Clostridium bowmanii]|uniref:NADH:flavin oxidoreductase n=1 Tax=Clostridium bowmanii TaxID=132925 RepID=UPI001C0E2529|nr:NADH:flavin oxidoreductase [Clostridium bowmanii]MBU3191367.1 NADH:flavin oxidoreductase [Clostridium bowmanii]MCA1075788.1 NADH:flavin oxidoreductase [Clostridium bowmanii]